MQDHVREWIALAELPGIGAGVLLRLIQQCQLNAAVGYRSLFEVSDDQLRSFNLPAKTFHHIKAFQAGTWPDADYLQIIERWLEQPLNHLISLTDEDYPGLLKEIPDAPVLLYVSGDPSVLHLPQLAIVGSRSASRNGISLSGAFARDLTAAGMTITSGLARGIDGAAHRAAVSLSKPTVAVLGSGLMTIYPRQHQSLAAEIIAHGGALVSEYPLEMPPLAYNFPRRNRIISGLSAGVLVIEAARRSGSLITARMALEQGREVFALPGALNNPQSHGCHDLIREGATLIETSAQIIEPLASLLGSYCYHEQRIEPECIKLTDSEAQLLNQMGYQLVTLEQLIELTGMPAAALLPQLVAMELTGYIENTLDGYQRLI
ncbi:DNA-processing protein DprA [Amphritea sp. 1_MG-2023]|uniref:DNA-processing protein DprA n=1 Tax=Amphritea sp. 1_MG-2023 TaxID=3062670 RepID=UPI0026E3A399|nr:DNA-processing protein DprA [Amphritea sp. 1_MG-2023]MDO6562350.1 DNA-processing protein DprA [Amphritea sp. 1_MG-2023]